jgi:uncharacterized membrane protein YkvA (DUF1232 family)
VLEIIKLIIICGTLLLAGFLILLALPNSRIRDLTMDIVKRLLATAAGAGLIVSPIDPIPDPIPVLGQLDDLGVLIFVAWYWYRLFKQR